MGPMTNIDARGYNVESSCLPGHHRAAHNEVVGPWVHLKPKFSTSSAKFQNISPSPTGSENTT